MPPGRQSHQGLQPGSSPIHRSRRLTGNLGELTEPASGSHLPQCRAGGNNLFAAVHGTGTSRCVIPPSAERLDPLPKITISTPDVRAPTPIYQSWYSAFG